MRRKRTVIAFARFHPRVLGTFFLALTAVSLPVLTHAQAQSSQRTRLILKDGSYQVVVSYKVSGDVVQYRSAERDGENEDIPLALVDLPATEKWAQEHAPGAMQGRPVLSPELAREEADRATRTPEIAPGLRLPKEFSILALDTFNSVPELIPLVQQGGDLNQETEHNVLPAALNPPSSPHRMLDLPGNRANVQLHLAAPVFYVRLGIADSTDADSGTSTIGTPAAQSSYKIEPLGVRGDVRVLNSFRIQPPGSKHQPEVIEVHAETLPGGHWLKLSPVTSLQAGEYALIEMLSDHEINLGVWDFGVHPEDPESQEAIRPSTKHATGLQDRP